MYAGSSIAAGAGGYHARLLCVAARMHHASCVLVGVVIVDIFFFHVGLQGAAQMREFFRAKPPARAPGRPVARSLRCAGGWRGRGKVSSSFFLRVCECCAVWRLQRYERGLILQCSLCGRFTIRLSRGLMPGRGDWIFYFRDGRAQLLIKYHPGVIATGTLPAIVNPCAADSTLPVDAAPSLSVGVTVI